MESEFGASLSARVRAFRSALWFSSPLARFCSASESTGSLIFWFAHVAPCLVRVPKDDHI